MTFNEYQEFCASRAGKFSRDSALSLMALGLAGESGECIELVKKHLYHGHSLDRDKLTSELGDVLWYVSQLAEVIGVPFEAVMQANVNKLKRRYPDGFTEKASIERKDV